MWINYGIEPFMESLRPLMFKNYQGMRLSHVFEDGTREKGIGDLDRIGSCALVQGCWYVSWPLLPRVNFLHSLISTLSSLNSHTCLAFSIYLG